MRARLDVAQSHISLSLRHRPPWSVFQDGSDNVISRQEFVCDIRRDVKTTPTLHQCVPLCGIAPTTRQRTFNAQAHTSMPRQLYNSLYCQPTEHFSRNTLCRTTQYTASCISIEPGALFGMEFTTHFGLHSQTIRLFDFAIHDIRYRTMYGTTTLYGAPFLTTLVRSDASMTSLYVTMPHLVTDAAFNVGLFPLHSPLLWESWLFSFPALRLHTECLAHNQHVHAHVVIRDISTTNTARTPSVVCVSMPIIIHRLGSRLINHDHITG
ncbi:hypothetical protein RF11_15296 [Thelohanellus kitauei]|uniref:Uncharacterized protein n=1 Tax=Thelohanellus kitauei TaxID=669202 RepID=A0A0C2N5N6_THEKT|nr:hypothetical protein RF11_15296 [Thelohanellus kitauei]